MTPLPKGASTNWRLYVMLLWTPVSMETCQIRSPLGNLSAWLYTVSVICALWDLTVHSRKALFLQLKLTKFQHTDLVVAHYTYIPYRFGGVVARCMTLQQHSSEKKTFKRLFLLTRQK